MGDAMSARSFALSIERAVTDDALDGQPWPPTGLMDGWVLVHALPDHKTLWRRISCVAVTTAHDDLPYPDGDRPTAEEK